MLGRLMTKDERLDDLINLSAAGWTLEAMGRKYGITRERVRQILLSAGVNKAQINAALRARLAAIPITCRWCGEQYLRGTHHSVRGKHVGKMNYPKRPDLMARDERIVADYDAGLKIREIMAKNHVKASAVTRALRYRGRKPDRHGGIHSTSRMPTIADSQIRMMAIARDYQAGQMLVDEITEKYGITRGMIDQAMKFAGGKTRTQGEAQRLRRAIYRARGLDSKGQPPSAKTRARWAREERGM